MSEPRYAPAIKLPPYSYVPGHDLPHPVNHPAGHLYASRESAHEPPISAAELAALPISLPSRRRALAAALAENPRWLSALDLYSAGFYWEAHEEWEGFWNALGRTTPEARFVQGLIRLAAAAVKIREGNPAGVARHSKRARELLGDLGAADGDGTLGLAPESISAVVNELEHFTPACWQTSRTPVVRVLVKNLRLPI
jgi:predicted metal-dependent hydrolase